MTVDLINIQTAVAKTLPFPTLAWQASVGILFCLTAIFAKQSSGQDYFAKGSFVHNSVPVSPIQLNTDRYDTSCGITVVQNSSLIEVTWPLDGKQQGQFTFDLANGHPLIHSIASAPTGSTSFLTIATDLDPILDVQVGDRDLKKRSGWTVFFDRMQRKPSQVHRAVIEKKIASVTSNARRATLTIGNVSAGPFHGHLRWTFYAGNSFVLQEAVLQTELDGKAFLFDTGLICRDTEPTKMTWHDSHGPLQSEASTTIKQAKHLAVRGRTIAAEFQNGSIGVFPPPHRYFYPLDFSTNLKNVWIGPNYRNQRSPFGFGIRHEPMGDNRYVPWFNAPPQTSQEMGVFLMISNSSGKEILRQAAQLTRGDQFVKLPNHVVFASHFHVEHALDFLKKSKEVRYKNIVPSSAKQPQVWQYTLKRPADTWMRPDFDDTDWVSGQAGFGRKGTRGLKFGTSWEQSDIWMRRTFNLSDRPPEDTKLMIHHDEDTEVYLNGVLAASATGFSTEYRYLPISHESLQTLDKGENVFAIHCRNDGGGQAIDAGLVQVEQYSKRVPQELQQPGFVKTFKQLGVDIVHLAEFHNGRTPSLKTEERLAQLETLHRECQRLSDDEFLLLPGEEPNVHLGGHWISFFPKPVYWVLNRSEQTPFVVQHPELGRVYHVGGEADVLRLLRAEHGLAWTAHPRIKSSTGFPDSYRDRLFFQSESFLGAAWKAMPADLSQPRLGSRVLDLLDDMSNWGTPKVTLGEVDVFKIEPDHELYGHMNVNYLRLDKIPKFADGWQSVLDTLRSGKLFVTTGEILIPEFTVNGKRSGDRAAVTQGGTANVRLDLKWTFPLSRAEIITGDGRNTKRQTFDLSRTKSFGDISLNLQVDVAGQRWLRVEVWDIATNGAFTQPVWITDK